MSSKKFSQKLKTIPPKPGIYWFKSKDGQIIYIGKALSLKHRLKSYFAKNIPDPKTKLMLSHAADFSFQLVPSEFEALLIEAQLIKEHRPKYNIQLMDNKSYLYIAITKKPFRIFPLRQTDLASHLGGERQKPSTRNINGLLDWFGPFPSGNAVHSVLSTLRKVFPYCSEKKVPKRQCLYSHLGLCPGWQNLNSTEYRDDIGQIRKVLGSKSKILSKRLEKKMKASANRQDFESAQKYKEKLFSLEYITQAWRHTPDLEITATNVLPKLQRLLVKYYSFAPTTIHKIEAYDISNLGHDIIVGSMVAFVSGQKDPALYRKFKIRFSTPGVASRGNLGLLKQNDPAGIYQIVKRRLNHPEWIYPQLIVVDGGKSQLGAAFTALKEKRMDKEICLMGLTKQEETIIIPHPLSGKISSWTKKQYSPRSEIRQLLQQIRDESHRFAQNYYKTLHRRKSFS